MTTRAKFVCSQVSKSKHYDGSGRFLYTAKLSPVMGNSEENKSFFASTPSGDISLGSFGEDLFEPGKQYYVDFTAAE